jgi:hypothetical protein
MELQEQLWPKPAPSARHPVATRRLGGVGHEDQAVGEVERLVDIVFHHHDGLPDSSQTRSRMSYSLRRMTKVVA